MSTPKTFRIGAWLQATPFTLVFVLFLVLPLALVAAVSFWQATDYELIPAFTAQNYIDIIERGVPSLSTLQEGLTSALMCLAARRSAETNTYQPIALP